MLTREVKLKNISSEFWKIPSVTSSIGFNPDK